MSNLIPLSRAVLRQRPVPLSPDGERRTPATGFTLKPAHCHEIFGDSFAQAQAAAGFALLAGAGNIAQESPSRPLLWLRGLKTGLAVHKGRSFIPYGPGLVALGLDPARCLFVTLPDRIALMKAAIDAVRCAGLGIVVMESWGRFPELGLTESRRFTLAARASGVTFLSLRLAAEPVPSAAETRWQVEAAPSLSPGADAPGLPAFTATCLRNRSGPAGRSHRLHWSPVHGFTPSPKDMPAHAETDTRPDTLTGTLTGTFTEAHTAPLSRAVATLSADRTVAKGHRSAA